MTGKDGRIYLMESLKKSKASKKQNKSLEVEYEFEKKALILIK